MMASSPITSWLTEGETMDTVTNFLFLVFKIIADSDCSHVMKRCLLLEKKVMTNLDGIFKSWDITLPKKVHIAKAMVFLVVMYRWKRCTIKKVESQRIDAFELWCWRRLLRVPWTAKDIKPVNPKGNQFLVFIEKTDGEAPIVWPPDAKHKLFGKDPGAGKKLKAKGQGGGRGWDG